MQIFGLEFGIRFCVYLAAVAAIAAGLHWMQRMPRFFSLLSLPGTVGHELLHLLVGTLTLARPVAASLLPKFHRDGSATLGYVMFANIRWYNALFVGFAPLLALPVTLWLVQYRSSLPPPFTLWELAWVYGAASLAISCTPSRADVEIVLSKPAGLVVYVAAAAGLAWLWLRA
jgi:hypothetical protein